MNTTHDLEATSYAPTSHAPRGEECTVASAWSSSPLGDPSGGAAYSDAPELVDDHYDIATDLIAPARKPWFISKGLLAGTLIAAVGLSAGLGITLLGHSNPTPRPVSATSGATAPVAAPFASLAPAPAPAPADSGPAPAPAVAVPADIPAPAPVAADIPAPAYIPAPAPIPDSGPPPAAPPPPVAPPPPAVVVAPPVPVFLPHPPLLPHPLNPAGPSHSIGCLPPHHLFGGVCH